MKYIKDTPRIIAQYIDSETNDVIFEVKNRNWTNIGELFTEHLITEVSKQNMDDNKPKKLLFLAFSEYTLIE